MLPLRFFAWLAFSSLAMAAAPDVWPLQVKASDPVAMRELTTKITAEINTLPPELKPAAKFQQLFLQIISGAKESAWSGDLKGLIAADATDPSPAKFVNHTVADLAKAWIARAQMRQIDVVLRNYYRHQVRFPAQFSEIEPDLFEPLRRDPWGEPWAYKTQAPEGFAKLTSQRYQLGPARLPKLEPLKEALGDRTAPPPPWKITARDIGGNRALEFRSGSALSTLQPGGKIDGHTLLFIGDGWALIASHDQLFTMKF